jgi:hypothetical protein
MRAAIPVLSIAFLFVHCSSSGNPDGKSSSTVLPAKADAAVMTGTDDGEARAADATADGPACVAPASAGTFDEDSGIGCRPSLDCTPQADGGEMCVSGCMASQYELLCTGVGTSFAPHPAGALNCSPEGIPGQIANLLRFCCACP